MSAFTAIKCRNRATSAFLAIISSAAFWMVAAAAQPGGHLLVRDVGLNETRTGILGVLVRMGAQVREAIEDVDQVEPRGIVEVTGAPSQGDRDPGQGNPAADRRTCRFSPSPARSPAAPRSFATPRNCA